MKKIGILTFHNAINYGAVLQCFALQETIKKVNNDVTIINYQSKNIKNSNKLLHFDNLKLFIKDFVFLPYNIVKKRKFDTFLNENLNLSNKIKHDSFDENVNQNYDIVIVGSDQVWNSKLVDKEEDVYFFKNIKVEKNSYSASVGNLTTKNLENIKEMTKDFKNVSVREEDLKEALVEKYNLVVEHTLDPTLLLTKNDWECSMVKDKNKVKDNYVLIYLLQQNSLFESIANYLIDNNFVKKAYTFSKKKLGIANISNKITAGPIEFVNMFYNSSYVVTNSFHGLAFSIIFEKQFFVLLPNEREGRLVSLLKKLKLENRIIKQIEDIPKVSKDIIDYNKVKSMLEKERINSINYIKKILENE